MRACYRAWRDEVDIEGHLKRPGVYDAFIDGCLLIFPAYVKP